MRKTMGLVLFLGLLGAPAMILAGTPVDVNFAESVYASGLSQITGLAWAPDGSNTLFVTQKGGTIRVVRNGTLQSATFGSITVFTNSECGLIGIAVDPQYATNKFVYVFATVSSSTQQVHRFTAMTDGSGNLVGSNRVQIGPNLPCMGVNHDGGALVFGPDQNLYFGVGNLGNGNNVGGNGTSGEFTSLGSKIGCMDRNGNAVSSNPYYNASDGITAADYIWARGMRNPFGLRFHPTTGALWLTEVGDSWEQVFLVPRNGNAGWPTENNTSTTNGLLIPKLAYRTNQSTFGGCITRGVFYSGTAFPTPHRGNLFFVDYNSGKVMRSVLNAAGDTITSTEVFVNGNSSLTDIVLGPDGALYYASHGGTVYRLRYTGMGTQNLVVSTSSLNVNEGAGASFTVRLAIQPSANVVVNVARTAGSTDVGHSPGSLTFTTSNWNSPQTVSVSAAEDADATNESATVTCSSSGLTLQNVTVNVIDNDTANGAPTASITQPVNGQVVSGTTAEFYGNGTDDVGCVKAEFWIDGVLRYTDTNTSGHYHFGGDHLRWDTTTLSNGTHTLLLKVFDGAGLSGSHQITVTVDNTTGAGGLSAEYYDATNFTTLRLSRVDPTVNFDWGSGSPDASVAADTFSVRWSGKVTPQYSQTYTFYTTTDDGVRLWVNNALLVDKWIDQGPTEWSGSIALTAGQAYDLRMEYYENGGGAVAKLSWSSSSQAKQIIPQSRLSPTASLPAPWQSTDIGSVGLAGSASASGGVFTVRGSGADIWNAADAFRYVYQPLGGDATLTARVTGVSNTDAWAKAGVMIREGLAPDARHAMMVITPGNGASFQRRTATAGASAHTPGPLVVAPYWVRLVRSGSTFTGYASSDGVAWTQVGSDTVPMGTNGYVGLAVTAHNNAALCTATFSNVSLTGTAYRQDSGADGLVSMEAERYFAKVDQGGKTWSVTTANAGFSGTSALQATPNSGVNNDAGYTTASPRLDFRVNFVKTGTHHVWIRGIGATGSDDSIHVGLDGAAVATSDRMSTFFTTWTWSRDTMDGVSATINVTTAGLHTINLWMREDGFVADKIVLSTNTNFMPSGTGPTESPR
jgi:glucose/arabinose dehydrogenase